MRRFSATVSSPAKRWYARLTASKLASLEREILKTAFGHVVCSARELEELRRIAPSARIAVIENGVDVASFSRGLEVASRVHQPAAPKIVFVGHDGLQRECRCGDFFCTARLAHAPPKVPAI